MPFSHSTIHHITVFRALQLGDMLCTVPALRALRRHFPEAMITLAGLPWAAGFVRRFNRYVDAFVHFPGYPGLPEQHVSPQEVLRFTELMQASNIDLVLQMQGNGSIVNPMIELWGARHTAGFWRKEDYCPDPDTYVEYPGNMHEIDRHLRLLRHLHIPNDGRELEFPITLEDFEAYNKLQLGLRPGRYIVVHPGSRGDWRQWPPAHFAAVANRFYRDGFKIVVTGTDAERPLTAKLLAQLKFPAMDLTGRTSLGAMGLLLTNAAGLLSNCTGVSHMAAALRTPSVVISMDGEPGRWAPLNRDLHTTIDWLRHPDLELVMEAADNLVKKTKSQI
ncbi:glycosyltransferase family 9 protein [Chitinophaga horti]|uniref:Glycosyltransferase family 9 protein n=1 Tax=Chitinophaga horti TaxID=2920382 RepID=A0ABY6J3K5_9BACT|nr:glycosyltransferase family 9 protein [Chitinophaga horti]UYQ94090.1 glycosyltransferase family 9 protein [Chitinophaga horti]